MKHISFRNLKRYKNQLMSDDRHQTVIKLDKDVAFQAPTKVIPIEYYERYAKKSVCIVSGHGTFTGA
jgi:hypothetical protein